ncbi:hypothetical protein UFOVP1077_26 [uncultured Caudovirales phage]|uniref:Uncharacterized protein n=1 Tax=uncultured Caudovirales phage TaxID=2100421 RepID=A0A6J5RV72_9CAUD|nr:hypothetical protein UFOVP1077_26 [uncultured Caudovirales phage]CAB4197471.1 hypothetical protein UFOVP1316_14 [uncultured Caudovirales phage]CAB4211383.1 hypothetical protein UFOVP1428_23 [uncultured Caudovirales phage]CAB5227233.1 hypothetical protein UFOVP1526_21 [uncultured Caudovirales phage]
MALSTLAAVAVGSTAYSVVQGERANSQQKVAMTQAKKAAAADAQARDIEFNAANKKKPTNLAALMAANLRAGTSSTNLTGPQGVTDPLSLSKTTALGA